MKLAEIKNKGILERPRSNGRTVPDGNYDGEITGAELVEKPSKYEIDNSMVAFTIKVQVENEDEEVIELFSSVNYNWSSRSKMYLLLEQLEVLPEPGESISLTDLEGMQVRVTVENIRKDQETYSNIISIKRIKTKKTSKRKPRYTREEAAPTKKRQKKEEKQEEYEEDINIDDIEDDEDYETADEGEDEYEDGYDEEDYDPLDDL